MVRRAIEKYHGLLERDERATREMAERIEEQLRRRDLKFGKEYVRISLRPHFISPSQMHDLRRACSVLAGSFAKVERLALADPTVMSRLGFEGEERELVRVEHGFPGSAIFSRLDCFFAHRGFRFVEFNVDSPAGGAYLDDLQRILFAEPLVQEFAGMYRLKAHNSRERILAALLRCYERWGGRDKPRIAIVDWHGVSTVSEFELLREYFEAAGVPSVICDPRELAIRGGRLHAAGLPVDIVYKRVVVAELLARRDEVSALIEAATRNIVCMVNPFRGKIVNVKALFDILTHEQYRSQLTARERAVIRDHIPWTRRVEEARTYYRGSKIDLSAFIRLNRSHLVLKPNDDYGGKGIYLGWECTDEQWESAIKVAMSACYVVQERVPVAEELFPIWDNGLKFVPYRYDTDPYFFGGEMAGCLARLSLSSLLNVTAGGAFVPTFEIRKVASRRTRR